MIRKLFLATLCACAVVPVLAQTSTTEEKVEYSADKYKVETNRFWSNWFISAGGGAQVYFGDHDRQCDFGDRIAPALDVMVGKWFTPGIGLRLGYSGLKIKGATKHPGDKMRILLTEPVSMWTVAVLHTGWRSRNSTWVTSMRMCCLTFRTCFADTTRHGYGTAVRM